MDSPDEGGKSKQKDEHFQIPWYQPTSVVQLVISWKSHPIKESIRFAHSCGEKAVNVTAPLDTVMKDEEWNAAGALGLWEPWEKVTTPGRTLQQVTGRGRPDFKRLIEKKDF